MMPLQAGYEETLFETLGNPSASDKARELKPCK